MTGRERLIRSLKGEKVDRAPVWLNHTFVRDENLNLFTDGWMQEDERLRALKEFYYARCEVAKQIWAPGSSRNLSADVYEREFVSEHAGVCGGRHRGGSHAMTNGATKFVA